MMKKTILVDWIQARVRVPVSDNAGALTGCRPYPDLVNGGLLLTVKDDNMQTQMFQKKYTVFNREGEEIAVLVANPRNTTFMSPDCGIIKVHNKYLYQKDLNTFFQLLLRELKLQFLNYTRVDVACDFEKFHSMEVLEFINSYANGDFLKSKKTKFSAHGESWGVGDEGQITGGYETVHFGTCKSDVQYRLYNKTKEMADVKLKPWVCEAWEANGWTGDTTVYRLEFEIHNNRNQIRDDEGQLYSMADIDFIDHADKVFIAHFRQYFNFVYRESTASGKIKKQSRCRPVVLFDDFDFDCVKIRVQPEKKDSSRATKIFAKALKNLNSEFVGTDFDLSLAGNDVLTWVIKTRNLEDWAQRKLGNVHLSDNVEIKLAKSANSELLSESILLGNRKNYAFTA